MDMDGMFDYFEEHDPEETDHNQIGSYWEGSSKSDWTNCCTMGRCQESGGTQLCDKRVEESCTAVKWSWIAVLVVDLALAVAYFVYKYNEDQLN